jgi:AcrR family transcriptional regulator
MLKLSPRRKREHEQHIRHILDVAESIFAEQGFFRTTMRQIALKAEFALGTIYSYFGSKKQLYGKVIETKVDELVAFVTREMEDAQSVQGQVEKFIQAKMIFLHKNLPFLCLYLAEVDVPRLDINHILPKKVRDNRVIVKAIDGLTNALALSWLGSAEAHLSLEADMRDVTELFLHGALIRQEPTQGQNSRKESNNEP